MISIVGSNSKVPEDRRRETRAILMQGAMKTVRSHIGDLGGGRRIPIFFPEASKSFFSGTDRR